MKKDEIKMFFDNEDELQECFEKWSPRLGLSNWIIGIRLSNKSEIPDGVGGWSEVDWVNKCGTIEILKKEDFTETLFKQPHEEILIHEMLHFKFFSSEGKDRDSEFYEMMQHQLLEELAEALFMAEYNLERSWFTE